MIVWFLMSDTFDDGLLVAFRPALSCWLMASRQFPRDRHHLETEVKNFEKLDQIIIPGKGLLSL